MTHESNEIKDTDFSFGHLLFSVLVVYCRNISEIVCLKEFIQKYLLL